MSAKNRKPGNERGAAVIELALLTTFIAFLTVSVVELGWLAASSVMVMNAASAGARFFANQRGILTPYTDTDAQIKSSASYLKKSNVSFSTSVGNTPCNANETCATDLNNAVKGGAVASATVTVTYAYKSLTGVTNILPKSLSATVAARVQ